MKSLLPFLLVTLILVAPTAATKGSMKLLAVQEETKQGSAADLFLELNPGKGRVFIDTLPLTKVDTQISTRFAKEVACSLLDRDCKKFDFVYTIRAGSYIIGGPSAGAPIAVLTMALLEGYTPDKSIALTGTINSGGYIGPVSGIKEKIDAAAAAKLKLVLIPSGTRMGKDEANETLDLVDYGSRIGIQVKEVVDIEDALYEFTGRKKKTVDTEIRLDDRYVDVMRLLADKLCSRSEDLQKKFLEARPVRPLDEPMLAEEQQLLNATRRAEEAYQAKNYYSAASYCFGSNFQYRKLYFDIANISKAEVLEKAGQLNITLREVESEIDKESLSTITDLQTYLIVKERLMEAYENLQDILQRNQTTPAKLAFAIERGYSAVSWSNFFHTGSKKVSFDEETLKESCVKKLGEAEERLQYAALFLPADLQGIQKDIESAYSDLNAKRFALCLFKASKAKAGADVILNNLGVQEDQLKQVIQNKISLVKRSINRQIAKGIFPILGYSYYEYASSLAPFDPISALIYIEYAAELSNFDMYFSNGKEKAVGQGFGTVFITQSEIGRFSSLFSQSLLQDRMMIFIAGIVAGLLLAIAVTAALQVYKKTKKASDKQMKKRKIQPSAAARQQHRRTTRQKF